MFGEDLVRLKSLRYGVTGMFYQALGKRERAGDLVVVTIDEYLTSQKVSLVVGFSVLACTACHTLWQRDVNAAINIMTIAKSVWGGEGRPAIFQRQHTTQ
ncbi:MAG: hypothetical protein EXX96DRAFT_585025 [Benjaminiella poitrasii]|nr:MAG: hypothetical protein EXX96DRAFT_585025 [Benjaminiella poitrasii]